MKCKTIFGNEQIEKSFFGGWGEAKKDTYKRIEVQGGQKVLSRYIISILDG